MPIPKPLKLATATLAGLSLAACAGTQNAADEGAGGQAETLPPPTQETERAPTEPDSYGAERDPHDAERGPHDAEPDSYDAEPAPAQPAPAAPSAGGAESVSDGELREFAEAYQRVMSAREPFEAKMAEAQTKEEAMDVQFQAQEAVRAAIVEGGLSVEDYSRIATAIDQSPELQQRFQAMIE